MRRAFTVLIMIAITVGIFFLLLHAGSPVPTGIYVTTSDSKYCYLSGYENGNMKTANKLYYITLTACGKPQK